MQSFSVWSELWLCGGGGRLFRDSWKLPAIAPVNGICTGRLGDLHTPMNMLMLRMCAKLPVSLRQSHSKLNLSVSPRFRRYHHRPTLPAWPTNPFQHTCTYRPIRRQSITLSVFRVPSMQISFLFVICQSSALFKDLRWKHFCQQEACNKCLTSPWIQDRFSRNLANGRKGSKKSDDVEHLEESLQWLGLALLKSYIFCHCLVIFFKILVKIGERITSHSCIFAKMTCKNT